MKRTHALIAVAAALVSAMALPASAMAFQITGGGGTQTQNPYGLWYAGQEACAQEGCHSQIAARETVHGNMVTDVKAFPAALVPSATSSFWPYSSAFGGLILRPRDMYLQVGDRYGFLEYIGANPSALATNPVPADDIYVWSPMEYIFGEHGSEGEWAEPTAPISYSSYSQSCSACHNLGVTRPSDKSYTLRNGAVQSTVTPSSVSALSIQCEVCHGSGKTPDGHKKGVPGVVGGTQMLKAQVCGQCHVGGTTPEKNAKGAAFGNPNGYTTDATLTAYLTPFTTVESETTFMAYVNNPKWPGVVSGMTKPKFLPNGADFSMRHDYYNEWLINKVPSASGGSKGHADPLNNTVASRNDPKCLRCHSGLGFLYRIGATGPSGKRIVPTPPSVSDAVSSDPGISCQVCHTGHVGYAAEGGYDSMRRWADGRAVGCGDCHNWQFEMLDQPVQYESLGGIAYSRPAADSRTRHPQREMVSGGRGGEYGDGGMWGVVPTGSYMADTACQDCHMPRTHREGMPVNDDGNDEATRQSHRFHIVLPGDAKRWKLRTNGDSCKASCHKEDAADYSRDEMQAWIDQKRSEVGTSSALATGALDAVASDLGLSSWTSFIAQQPKTGASAALTAGTWSMLQHAAQNADFVVSDASGGIHNPAYALAGLRKSILWAQAATATIEASLPPVPVSGAGVNVTGTLRGYGGVLIDDAEVRLEQSADGGTSWSVVDTATPDITGAFAIPTGRIIGSKLFRCSFTPHAGVTFSSATMNAVIPVTAGTLAPSSAHDGWVDVSSVNVALGATPAGLTAYALSGATTRAQTIYTGAFDITAEGQTDVRFFTSNAQGVEAPITLPVRIDRAAPVLACDAVASYADKAVVRVSATDAGAGVATFEYALDGAPLAIAPDTWGVVSVTALGSHTLTARATDGAGKVSQQSWSFDVRTAPRVAKSPSGSSYRVGYKKYWTTKVTLSTASGTRIAGKAVQLQRSTNGRTWKTHSTVVTDGSGRASRSVRFSSRGTTYWRWSVPQDASYFSATGSRTKITVK